MAIQQTLKYEADVDKDFGRWVAEAIGGEKIQHCIQCGTCSSSCPLSFYMDYPPRQLIYLARETKWWQMWGMRRLGWGLLRTGRFSLKKESIRNPREIAALLDAVGAGKEVAR